MAKGICQNKARLRPDVSGEDGLVESEGIEPSSREDKTTDSTCLVDFDFRELEGRQQPNQLLSY
jgi:hypothetical protein